MGGTLSRPAAEHHHHTGVGLHGLKEWKQLLSDLPYAVCARGNIGLSYAETDFNGCPTELSVPMVTIIVRW